LLQLILLLLLLLLKQNTNLFCKNYWPSRANEAVFLCLVLPDNSGGFLFFEAAGVSFLLFAGSSCVFSWDGGRRLRWLEFYLAISIVWAVGYVFGDINRTSKSRRPAIPTEKDCYFQFPNYMQGFF
jgi:hypothetical protein